MFLEQLSQTFQTIIDATYAHWSILASLIGILFIAYFFILLSGHKLLILGIYPRNPFGLIGILFAPFLHANFNHLFFNSIPLIVLANFILISGVSLFINITIYITLFSGGLIWLFGRPALHIGASSLITGYWAFLVMNIYQQGTVMAIFLGLISLYYFFGIFLGIFPQRKGISWEGHLFGLIAGIMVAYFLPLLPLLYY